MAKRPRVGDVFELRTPCGFGYVQYTHEHPELGDLVRVLPGVYPVRPGPIDSLVAEHRFFVFYPVSSAARAGDAELVANQPVPEPYQAFPLMRWGDHGSGYALWNGTRQVAWRRRLRPEERDIPERETWTHGLVVERMASVWSWADCDASVPWPTPPRVSPCYDVGYVGPDEND